jgi:hypothetical protein
VQQGRIEQDRVSLAQWQLHVVGEVRRELRPVERQVPGFVPLGVRQVEGRPGFDRQVAVGDRALQAERGGEPVHVGGEPRRLPGGHEAQVVVAVQHLGRAARVDHIDLGGVAERPGKDDDAGPVHERPRQLRLYGAPACRGADGRTRALAVEEDVLLDGVRAG